MKTTEELYQYIIGKIRENMGYRERYGKDSVLYRSGVTKITGMLELFEVVTGKTLVAYQQERSI